MSSTSTKLSHTQMLQLKRWNTPTIYNGWEQISKHDRLTTTNLDPVNDYMPQMGAMVGHAVTLVIEPSNPEHRSAGTGQWMDFLSYVASQPGPKIVVVQDLDKPRAYGSVWGEVSANTLRALGCVGTITDGAVRDVDEMNNAGFKALARQLCVGHAHAMAVRWDEPVEAFGCRVEPGQLIHADKHGFIAIPRGDEPRLLEAAQFMDANECRTVIDAARDTAGRSSEEILDRVRTSIAQFSEAVDRQFGKQGEW